MNKPEVVHVFVEGPEGCDVQGFMLAEDETGLFRVSFRYDGDSVDVEHTCAGLHYARRGRQYVDVTYTEGQSSVCRIGDGKHSGEFPVYTESVEIARKGKQTDVCVAYRTEDGCGVRKIVKLRICKGD
ncbi:MAG: hypothetical protein LUD50_08000 [Clostridia bacterium]|nr:hypothetical protein [Clostridia bacterium]